MGASTWAFGSQRCIPYSGIFTRNAKRQPAHHILSAIVSMGSAGAYCRVRRERVPVVFCKSKSATSSGRDAASV